MGTSPQSASAQPFIGEVRPWSTGDPFAVWDGSTWVAAWSWDDAWSFREQLRGGLTEALTAATSDNGVSRQEDAGELVRTLSTGTFNASGAKYLRPIRGAVHSGPTVTEESVKAKVLTEWRMDVYAVLLTFGVTCPATQHAIKKLLCAGLRDKGSLLQDLSEARDAIDRALQLYQDINPDE